MYRLDTFYNLFSARGPTASFPRSQMERNSSLPLQRQPHAHVKPQTMASSGAELSHRRKRASELLAISGFNESWDGCQRGFRGNALICEACAELRAGVGRIWSLKQTSFPGPRLHTANFCRRPDGWMMPMPAPLSLHKHVRSTLLDDIFQTEIPLAGWNAEEVYRKLPPK